ncbi:tetratricopeptide repeat protein [Novosphingobium flavum]|uniref:Tetratricopeptide repeat protein n=1 Tax=Novosphingobium flavum TaxID=1778672 RepID=A0A7X1FPP0_9SPHN|nr:tetratricopeptide repeat protein [Novosphingobium flavum]MBC2664087.1 tetratricopeptide repeat protein [Novosphingobium flavum]
MNNPRIGRLVLGAAALILGFAVVYTATRNKTPAAPPEAAASASAADPLAALEQAAQNAPSDPAAWRALGSGLFNAGRFAEAASAYEKAANLAPSLAVVWSSLGEARVMASKSDPMPAEALSAFRKAAGIDPKDPRARYFLAVNRDLTGDHEGAITDWLALLSDTPPGAPWEADLRRTIEQVGKIHKIEVASRLAAVRQPAAPAGQGPSADMPLAAQGIPGPTTADLKAAAAIPPSQQRQMAETMVARLESKFAADPKNVDGWIMLMRSRITLGQPDKASAALKSAIAANPAQTARIRQEAGVLGVQ